MYAADLVGSCPQYYPGACLTCEVGVWVWNLGAVLAGGVVGTLLGV